MNCMIHEFFKFCIVGTSGLVVDFGITSLCKEKLHIYKYVANALGFLAAASSNFMLNRYWTFRGTLGDAGRQYLRFLIIAMIGLAINSLVIYILHDRRGRGFYFSKICATAIVTFWNFFMNYFFNF